MSADTDRQLTPAERRTLVNKPLPKIRCTVIPGRTFSGYTAYDEEGNKVLTPNSYNARTFGQDLVTQD